MVLYTEANCIRNEYHHYLRNNRLAEQVPNSIEIKRFISFCCVYITIAPPEWWWWGVTEQTVEHLYMYTRCREWRKQRRNRVRELEREGVKWQF